MTVPIMHITHKTMLIEGEKAESCLMRCPNKVLIESPYSKRLQFIHFIQV
jgi:hypothetical protein